MDAIFGDDLRQVMPIVVERPPSAIFQAEAGATPLIRAIGEKGRLPQTNTNRPDL